MDHDSRARTAAGPRRAGRVSRECVPRRRDFHRRPGPDTESADAWDVSSWTTEPGRTFRLNSLFDRIDGAVVTATGRFDDSKACAELAAALRPFERLGCAIVVDLCHATLGLRAARTLVEIGSRHSAGGAGHSLTIAHAERANRRRIERAGGQRLLQPPCARCRAAAG